LPKLCWLLVRIKNSHIATINQLLSLFSLVRTMKGLESKRKP
jgi:hypothetical protein